MSDFPITYLRHVFHHAKLFCVTHMSDFHVAYLKYEQFITQSLYAY